VIGLKKLLILKNMPEKPGPREVQQGGASEEAFKAALDYCLHSDQGTCLSQLDIKKSIMGEEVEYDPEDEADAKAEMAMFEGWTLNDFERFKETRKQVRVLESELGLFQDKLGMSGAGVDETADRLKELAQYLREK